MKTLIPKQVPKRFLKGLGFKTFRIFVLVVGLAMLFIYYDPVAHAEFIYSFTKTMGGTDHDVGHSVAVDSSDNVYITGFFSGTNVDFNPGTGTDYHTSFGLEDIFLTKINADGSYGWTITMGGTSQDVGQSVAVDSSDNVYITGFFSETADFDPVSGPDFHTSAGLKDIFLTKINADGSYDWTITMGGTDQDVGQSVAVDSSDNVYITGYFSETADFDPVSGPDFHTSAGLKDIFLTKINADGSYGYTKTMGGTDQDVGQAVTVDSSDNVNVYLTGYFSGTNVNFNPGAGTDYHTSVGLEDIFLTKINADGSYGYTKTMGGTDHDVGQAVVVDSSDNVYITGFFSGTNADFNPGIGTDYHTSAGLEDIFLTKINADGNYGYTKTMGGTDQDVGQSVAFDSSDNIYITGFFSGTNADFNPGSGTDYHTSAGLEDIFITKINFDGSYDATATMGGTDHDVGQAVAVDSINNVYITGFFSGTNADFNPGAGTDYHTSAGLEDIFLTKFRLVGFVVTPTSVTTNGAGDEASFTVRLLSEPLASVTFPVSSSDLTVGTVDKYSLTFTDSDWSVNQTITVTSLVSSSQTYRVILAEAISDDADYNGLNPTDVTVNNVGSDSDSSGCFIATAAYGSLLAPKVKIMREFRDRFLIGNTGGKIFVRFYYTYSPPIADFIAEHDSLRAIVRISLLPFVGFSWIALKIGFTSAVVLMLIFISCLVGIVRFKKNKDQKLSEKG